MSCISWSQTATKFHLLLSYVIWLCSFICITSNFINLCSSFSGLLLTGRKRKFLFQSLVTWVHDVIVNIIIGCGFCDIQNNQVRGVGYQPNYLDYSGCQKTTSNNCFTIHWRKKNGSHVFASSLMGGSTGHANLTWLPLEMTW